MNTDKLIGQIRSGVREGKLNSSKTPEQVMEYLDNVQRGKIAPDTIVRLQQGETGEIAVTREETIQALRDLGIENPRNYPSLMTLGPEIVGYRIKTLKTPNLDYQFNGIRNPASTPLILTHQVSKILEHNKVLKTPDPDDQFDGIKNPESAPQIYGHDPATIKSRVQILKRSDSAYHFNGIAHPENSPLLLTEEPITIKQKTKRIKERLLITDIENHVMLLQGDDNYLEEKTRAIDQIQGLRISYKAGAGVEKVDPMILLPNPESIARNLVLLEGHGINHVVHDRLLRSSTEKLERNIQVCQIIGFNFVNQPYILQNATKTLMINSVILRHLGIPIVAWLLGKSIQGLIATIRKGGEVRIHTPLAPERIQNFLDQAIKVRIYIPFQLRRFLTDDVEGNQNLRVLGQGIESVLQAKTFFLSLTEAINAIDPMAPDEEAVSSEEIENFVKLSRVVSDEGTL